MRIIPEELKLLAVAAVRFFGSNKDVILMETLVKYDCIEEERLERILRFDHRLLESQISNLLTERMVHKRIEQPEVGGKRKSKIRVYYFVNYKSLADIVQFKLYRMRRTLEESITKANQKQRSFFKCSNTNCRAEFGEVQARELFHPSKNQFICVYCQNVVEELSDAEGEDFSMRMAKFNEYTQPLLCMVQAASAFCVEEEPKPDLTDEQCKSMTVHLINSGTDVVEQMDTSSELAVSSTDHGNFDENFDDDTACKALKHPLPVSTNDCVRCDLVSDEIFERKNVHRNNQVGKSKPDSAINILEMLKSTDVKYANTENIECMSDSEEDITDNQSDSDSFESVENSL